MTTQETAAAIDPEIVAQAARKDQQLVQPLAPIAAPQLRPPAAAAPDARTVDVKQFVRDNRIHIENGSLFIDPYLVIHPRELDPANDAKLQQKLRLTYSINNPSFFESSERLAVALNMGQLIPVPLQAKRSKLMEAIKQFNGEATGNVQDVNLAQQANDRNNPMAAIVRDTLHQPEIDPVGLEMLKNSLAVYMLCREKLTQRGYLGKLSDYVKRVGSPDQVFSDLQEEMGVTPGQIQDAALSGGIDGVGKLLGLDPRYVADVKRLAELSAKHDFSYNMVEHWHIGRQMLGLDASLEQKISTGMEARISTKIKEYRARVRHHYEVPEPIQKEEARIADALKLVHPTQVALMHELGYEICFTPEQTADRISFHPHVYGLHRKSANDLRDINGTYRIYFSGKGDLKQSMRTLVHEITHNLWPQYFAAEEVKAIDTLAASDRDRFRNLSRLMDERFDDFAKLVKAYHAGNDKEKKAVLATMNEQFAGYGGITFDSILPTLKDPYELMWMAKHANDRLHVEGEMYNKSGYDTPQERFREVLSRFAEVKLVELRDNKPLLEFIAPGLNKIFDSYYIPHLERVRADMHAHPTTNPPVIQIAPQQAVNDNQPEVKDEPKVRNEPAGKAAACQANDTSSTPKSNISVSTVRAMEPAFQALHDLDIHVPH